MIMVEVIIKKIIKVYFKIKKIIFFKHVLHQKRIQIISREFTEKSFKKQDFFGVVK